MSRGRPANIIPSDRINLHLPVDIKSRLDLHLFSSVEGRIPKGAYSKFFEERVREFFARIDEAAK